MTSGQITGDYTKYNTYVVPNNVTFKQLEVH